MKNNYLERITNIKEFKYFLHKELKWCMCGFPYDALMEFKRILNVIDRNSILDELCTDNEGLRYIILYYLDTLDLTVHGGCIIGSGLSIRGKGCLNILNSLTDSEFEYLDNGISDYDGCIDPEDDPYPDIPPVLMCSIL